MAFGALFRNGNDVKVIGEDVESLVFTDETASANRVTDGGWYQYEIPHKAGRIPAFQLTASMTAIMCYFSVSVGYGIGMPGLLNLQFSGGAPATLPYRYLCSSSEYGGTSASYGMRLFGANGEVTYDSGMPLAHVTRTTRPSTGDIFPMTNGRWIALPFWMDNYEEDNDGYRTFEEVGVVIREGSTQNWKASLIVSYGGALPKFQIGCIMEIQG